MKTRFTPVAFRVDTTPAFAHLGLAEVQDEVGALRVRQHVNPLSNRYNQVQPAPVWADAFADPTRPLVVDIGCGYGRACALSPSPSLARTPCTRSSLRERTLLAPTPLPSAA